jgi:predicted PurR-regulated permease PerM
MSFPPPSERQARLLWLALSAVAMAVLVGLLVALIWGLGRVLHVLAPVLWPLAVAAVLACLLDPVVDWLEHRGLRRTRAILCVFGLALALIALLFASVVPQVINETRQLGARIPEYVRRMADQSEAWINNPPPIVRQFLQRDEGAGLPPPSATSRAAGLSTNHATQAPTEPIQGPPIPLWKKLDPKAVDAAVAWVKDALPKAGAWLFGQVGRVASWFGVLAGLALIPVYTFYLLLERRRIESRWTDYLPVADSGFKDETVFVIQSINSYLVAFFRGQVLVAICDGILYATGFLIIGLPYAVLIGVVATFLTMIPYLGAIVTCVTALFIALVQFGGWVHPLLVLVVFAIVQTLEGLVISPKIMGDRVGLHPLTIIIAVMTGTTLLGGLLGGVLAIPLTAVLRVLLSRYIWKKNKV